MLSFFARFLFSCPFSMPDRHPVAGIKDSEYKNGSWNLSPAPDCVCYFVKLCKLFPFYSLNYISLFHSQPLPQGSAQSLWSNLYAFRKYPRGLCGCWLKSVARRRMSAMGRAGEFWGQAAAADPAHQDRLRAICLACTWLVGHRKEWKPIKKDDLLWN